MSHQRRSGIALGMTLLLVVGAWSQVAAPLGAATLPPQLVAAQSSSSITPDQLQQIESFVEAQAAKLSSDDPAEQSSAREMLCSAVLVNGQPGASPVFLDRYAGVVNAALLELSKHENLRVRLNAAIVAARVAERADNTRLMESALAFMKDSSCPVALWGMRTARWIMPAVMRNELLARDHNLVDTVVAVAKAQNAGPVVQEAYEALAVPQNPALVVASIQELLQFRLDQYAQATPADAAAENRATLFLTDSRVWRAQNPAQQARTARQVAALAKAAVGRVASGTKEEKDAALPVVVQSAKAAWVIGQYIKDPKITAAAESLAKLSSPLPQIVAQAEELYQAVNQSSALAPAPRE